MTEPETRSELCDERVARLWAFVRQDPRPLIPSGWTQGAIDLEWLLGERERLIRLTADLIENARQLQATAELEVAIPSRREELIALTAGALGSIAIHDENAVAGAVAAAEHAWNMLHLGLKERPNG